MKQHAQRFILFACIMLLVLQGYVLGATAEATIDLRGIDWNQVPSQGLKEVWEFYPGVLLYPGDFSTSRVKPYLSPISQRQWVDKKIANLPVYGFGTYRVLLQLDPGVGDLALLPGIINSSASIWYDGKLLARYGNPGTGPSSTTMGWENTIHPLPPLPAERSKAELVIQVANWGDPSPSFAELPLVGKHRTLMVERNGRQAMYFLLIGFCLAFGIYHFFRFAFRSQEITYLIFTGICWTLALRIAMGDSMPLLSVFPALGWEASLRINFATFPLLVFFTAAFMGTFFSNRLSGPYLVAAGTGSLAYLALVALAPLTIFGEWLLWYQIYTILIGLIAITMVLSALIQRRTGAVIFSIGFAGLFAAAIHDIVIVSMRIPSPSLALYGIVFFMVAQALVLSRHSASLVKTTEELSRNLQIINTAQARFLPRELMNQLKKNFVTDIAAGDCIQSPMAILVLEYDVSFTDHSAKEGLSAALNAIHTAMGPLIREHHGFVNQYQAHGLVALFPEGPHQALTCALEAIKAGRRGILREGSPLAIHTAIHHGEILLGLLGESERMNGEIMTHHLADTRKMLDKGKKLGSLVTVSHDAAGRMGILDGWQYRQIGALVFEHKAQAIYDFFDADPQESWKSKRASKRLLLLALRAQALHRKDEAENLFRQVLAKSPRDPVARYHLDKLGVSGNE